MWKPSRRESRDARSRIQVITDRRVICVRVCAVIEQWLDDVVVTQLHRCPAVAVLAIRICDVCVVIE